MTMFSMQEHLYTGFQRTFRITGLLIMNKHTIFGRKKNAVENELTNKTLLMPDIPNS